MCRHCYDKKTAASLCIKSTLAFKEVPSSIKHSLDEVHDHSLPLHCDQGAKPHMDLELHSGL